MRGIPEIMFCRILMFTWSFGVLVGGPANLWRSAGASSRAAVGVEVK